MSIRFTRRLLLLAGAVALVGVIGTAGSQVPAKPLKDSTRNAAKPAVKKLPIVKERTAGGDVRLTPAVPCESSQVPLIDPMHDAAVRNDQFRLDSINAALDRALFERQMLGRISAARFEASENTRRRMEADRAAEENALRLRMQSRGIYMGLAGGASTPMRSVRDSYTGGYNFTIPVGFDASDVPLGYRVDLSVDHLNGTRVHDRFANTVAANGDITVWSLNFDLKTRMQAPGTTRTHLYALGGVGAHRVSGGVYGTATEALGDRLEFRKAGTKLGWNAGVGAAFAWGPTELFVESRFVQVKTNYDFRLNGGLGKYTSFTPVVVGLSWF